jgi:hypothetical protein
MSNRVGMNIARGALALVAILAIGSRTASAQYMVSGGYAAPHPELWVFGGGFFPSSIYTGSNANPLTFSASDEVAYGAGLSYIGNSGLGGEFTFGRSVTPVYANGLSTGYKNVNVGSAGFNMYDFDGIFQSSSRQKVIGYFEFGLGMTDINTSPPPGTYVGSGGLRFAYNLGIGVKIKPSINSPIAIRIDGRYRGTYLDRTTNSATSCSPYYGCWSYSTNNYSSGVVTGGIVYSFK